MAKGGTRANGQRQAKATTAVVWDEDFIRRHLEAWRQALRRREEELFRGFGAGCGVEPDEDAAGEQATLDEIVAYALTPKACAAAQARRDGPANVVVELAAVWAWAQVWIHGEPAELLDPFARRLVAYLQAEIDRRAASLARRYGYDPREVDPQMERRLYKALAAFCPEKPLGAFIMRCLKQHESPVRTALKKLAYLLEKPEVGAALLAFLADWPLDEETRAAVQRMAAGEALGGASYRDLVRLFSLPQVEAFLSRYNAELPTARTLYAEEGAWTLPEGLLADPRFREALAERILVSDEPDEAKARMLWALRSGECPEEARSAFVQLFARPELFDWLEERAEGAARPIRQSGRPPKKVDVVDAAAGSYASAEVEPLDVLDGGHGDDGDDDEPTAVGVGVLAPWDGSRRWPPERLCWGAGRGLTGAPNAPRPLYGASATQANDEAGTVYHPLFYTLLLRRAAAEDPTLSPLERKEFRLHLLICPRCRWEYAQVWAARGGPPAPVAAPQSLSAAEAFPFLRDLARAAQRPTPLTPWESWLYEQALANPEARGCYRIVEAQEARRSP